MKTNEDIAKWIENTMLERYKHDSTAPLRKDDAEWLRAAASALRRLDAQTDADNSVFHVAFDTGTIPGSFIVTTVRIGCEVMGDNAARVKKFNIGLCNHPSYQNLRQYILANPEANLKLPTSLRIGGEDDGAAGS